MSDRKKWNTTAIICLCYVYKQKSQKTSDILIKLTKSFTTWLDIKSIHKDYCLYKNKQLKIKLLKKLNYLFKSVKNKPQNIRTYLQHVLPVMAHLKEKKKKQGTNKSMCFRWAERSLKMGKRFEEES